MLRIALFLLTNLAVMVLLTIVVKITGIDVPEVPEAHHFVFGADGKVASFTHIGDWAVHEAATPGGRTLVDAQRATT